MSALNQWLELYKEIQLLQSQIDPLLEIDFRGTHEDEFTKLMSLTSEQDQKIQSLPFDSLNESEAAAIAAKAEQILLQQNKLTEQLASKRQTILDTFSAAKKSLKGINSYADNSML